MAEHALAADGVTLTWLAPAGLIALRGRSSDRAFVRAAGRALGLTLPLEPNTTAGGDELLALWTSPETWHIRLAPEAVAAMLDRLRAATDGRLADVHDIGDARTRFRIEGPNARALLAKGTGLDLHPRAFAPTRCAQTLFAQLTVLLHRPSDAPAFELHADRPAERYLWSWLGDAAREWRRS